MKYIINYSNDAAFNIALEEYAFKHLLDEDQIFLLWINKPSIIVGRHQNTIEEINRDYVREHGIEVVRRISGGGAVYHDLNNLNYTIISKEDENKAFDFKSFSTPVISDEELAEINHIKETKFGTWDWNYGKSPEYNVRRGTKFSSGKVEIFANVIESKIQDIKIYGDFFGIEDVAAVEDVLRGVKYEREDVLKALQTINLGRYFAGITAEEIAEAVVE